MAALCLFLFALQGRCATVSPLLARGYTVLPEPQRVVLGTADFRFGADWRLELGNAVRPDSIAVQSLKEDLDWRFHVRLSGQGRAGVLRLAIVPRTVAIGEALDRDKDALAAQAYKIDLSKTGVRITANAPAGLFYGVETLIQLIKAREGALWLPEGQIIDWPDLQLRHIYWDDAHHLDRFEELKRAIRQAAFFKINGFVIKIEGHFQYNSAPALVEPQALSPAQFQELTDYALRHYVQLIPYLDGPAHIAFILKHPEYAALRAFAESNYELCVTNPYTYKLLYGMYEDLLAANKGARYFYLSTDEPYYVGMADNSQCRETPRARERGSVGKLLAEFITKTANFLHDRGRTVIFWGEFPLKPDDITSLPSHLVNGEVYGPAFDPVFKAHNIRQMIYTSTEGEEKLFPAYFVLPALKRLHLDRVGTERVPDGFDKISFDPARKQADLMGVVVAGWADMGLHPETFWLGYATITAAGWRPASPDPRESMSAFYPLFYGPSVVQMDRVYQLMSLQAQSWSDSWDTASSTARKPIFGNSEGIFTPPQPARDQVIPLPPVPDASLAYESTWARNNARRLELVSESLADNDELLGLLRMNFGRAEFNRFNLQVFLSIAQLYRQNLDMLEGLGRINGLLEAAQAAARKVQPKEAIAAVDRALDIARQIQRRRNTVLRDTTATWYLSWHPRVAEANGRRFLHELDDVKDHLSDRTIDMSYLVYRELLLPFGEWAERVQASRNQYAETNRLPLRTETFDWKNLEDAY